MTVMIIFKLDTIIIPYHDKKKKNRYKLTYIHCRVINNIYSRGPILNHINNMEHVNTFAGGYISKIG